MFNSECRSSNSVSFIQKECNVKINSLSIWNVNEISQMGHSKPVLLYTGTNKIAFFFFSFIYFETALHFFSSCSIKHSLNIFFFTAIINYFYLESKNLNLIVRIKVGIVCIFKIEVLLFSCGILFEPLLTSNSYYE